MGRMKRLALAVRWERQKMVLLVLVLAGLLGIAVAVLASPTSYIHQKTGFFCIQMPRRIYNYNAIDHGRDYDSLHVYLLKELDTERLSQFAARSDEWRPLPLPDEVLAQEVCNAEYDAHMPHMLNAQSGWWRAGGRYGTEEYFDLYVFEDSTNMLFMRTASVFVSKESQ